MIGIKMCLTLVACCCGGAFTVSAASYEYGYGVADPVTGDVKEQREAKDCDQVTGYYKTLDADGMMRTVTYTSHPLTGFQAQVDRQPYGAVNGGPIVEPLMKAAGPAIVEQKALVPAIDVKEEIRVQTPVPALGVKLTAPPAEWRRTPYEHGAIYASPAPAIDIKPGLVAASPAPFVETKIAAFQGPMPLPIGARFASPGLSPYYYRSSSLSSNKWIAPEHPQYVPYMPAAIAAGPKYYSAVPEPCDK